MFLFIIFYVLPFISTLRSIFTGSIPFWYDPARDLLLAWNVWEKLTLIGQPCGLPGIFYGPYWIWFISLIMHISRDPEIIGFFLMALPYYILFPLLLFKFRFIWSKLVISILWLLFILAFHRFSFYIWNPYLAPIIYLYLVYLLVKLQTTDKKLIIGKLIYIGFINGLLMNFHLAFGLGIFAANGLLLLIFFLLQKKSSLINKIKIFAYCISVFIAGILFSWLPWLIFELRHDFLQIKAIFSLLIKTVDKTAVVSQQGLLPAHIVLAPYQLLQELTGLAGKIITYGLLLVLIWTIVMTVKKKFIWKRQEIKLGLIILVHALTIIGAYLLWQFPVWEYHFVGVEIILLLFLGLVMQKIPVIKYILLVWSLILLVGFEINFIKSLKLPLDSLTTLDSQKKIVDQVYQDANKLPFAVTVYSSAIYTYEYDYLFKWRAEHFQNPPIADLSQPDILYLIIATKSTDIRIDFVNYKSPNEIYQTVKEWETGDGTLIIKRQKK